MNRVPAEQRRRIAVVGGGMAGLGAAYELERHRRDGESVEWLLIEKDGRLGGKVRSERVDGFVIEGGPDSFIVEKPWPIQLARELGVEERVLDSNEDIRKSFIYSRGRLHELPEGLILMVPTRLVPFAMSSLISWPGKARMGLDLALPRGAAARAGGDESLGDFVRRRLGREALDKIAEPIVAGIHAGNPEVMSVRSTFPMFLEMEQKYRSLMVGMVQRRRARARAAAGRAGAGPARKRSYFLSFETGLADLADAVVAALPADRLRLGVSVERLERLTPEAAATTATNPSDVIRTDDKVLGSAVSFAGPASPAYRLTLGGGSDEVVDAVVLATPAFASGELLKDVSPEAAAGLSSIPYVSSATVSMAFRRAEVAHPLRGFGYVTPRAEGRAIMATTWSSTKFRGRAPEGYVLVRSFVGRAGFERYASLDDGELLALVREELAVVLGIHATPVLERIFRWPLGMPQYRVGHADLVRRIEEDVARVPGVEIAGGAYHGIGIGDCIREGRAAAQRAVEHVQGLPEDPVPPQPADVPGVDGLID